MSVMVKENEIAGNTAIIAIMGATGTGKTTFINLVSGARFQVGKGLHSCTAKVETTLPFEVDGRNIILIDTPGFDDTTESDTIILQHISDYLTKQYAEGTKLAGVIYMHHISDFRMGEMPTRNFKMFRSLCRDTTLKNVVIVTNMWDKFSREIGGAREAELANDELFFEHVLDKKAQFVRHDNTVASARSIIRLFSKNEPKASLVQTEIIDEGKNNPETAAAQVLHHELIEQKHKHGEERRQNELGAPVKQQAEARKAHEEVEQRRMTEEMEKAEAEGRQRAAELQEEKEKLERKMWHIRQEAERVAAVHQRLEEEAEKGRNREAAETEERAALEAARYRRELQARRAREAEQRRRDREMERAKAEAQRQAERARVQRERIRKEMRESERRARVIAKRHEAERQSYPLRREAEWAWYQAAAAREEHERFAQQLSEETRQRADYERRRCAAESFDECRTM